ncbi:MAG: hypothetical protein CL868_07295 [Cytophagaceae bacterium]|nr:hypothetical protein [Cytophagaceae bacterium]|tara:strand:+ start:754 stop:1200 length:447 start_codon:yes stop_codon:yes gene_type:complete
MVLQEENTFKKTGQKELTFINQRAKWKMVVGLAGIVIAALSFFIYKGFEGNLLYMLGMFMLFIPTIIPLKFKNFVRYQKDFVHIKLDTGKGKTFKPSFIREIEVFNDKIYVWKTKNKKETLKIDGYSESSINRLIAFLKGEKTGLRQS